jgi:sugar phosphate permease
MTAPKAETGGWVAGSAILGETGRRPTRVRYRVVGFALTLAILSYIQRVAISQAATPISADLGLDKQQMGAILGAFGLSYALFEIPMGVAGDRLGVKRVLARIVIAWSVFTALTGAAWNLASMWVIRFLFGAGEAGCFPNLTRMLSEWLPAGERLRAQALMWASTRWGGAVAPPLALLGITLFGWRWSFVLFAVLGIVWAIAFAARFREDPATHPAINRAELDLLEGSRTHMSHIDAHWARVLVRPRTLMLVLQYFCWSYCWYFFVTWLPTYLQEAHGQSAAATAGLSTLPMLMGGVGCLVSGLLPLAIPRRFIAIGSFSLVAVLLLIIPGIDNVAIVIALMALIAFAGDLTVPISWNGCVEIGRGYTATVAAGMNMLGNLSGFIAPSVTGIILKHNGNDWSTILYLMAGIAALGAVLWLFLDITAPDKKGELA